MQEERIRAIIAEKELELQQVQAEIADMETQCLSKTSTVTVLKSIIASLKQVIQED